MIYTTVAIKRGSNQATVVASVPVQIDDMSQMEAAYYGGAAPYFRYLCLTYSIVDVQQGDLLPDASAIDPKTGVNVQYRVVSDPEPFPDQHMEFVLDKVRGT